MLCYVTIELSRGDINELIESATAITARLDKQYLTMNKKAFQKIIVCNTSLTTISEESQTFSHIWSE